MWKVLWAEVGPRWPQHDAEMAGERVKGCALADNVFGYAESPEEFPNKKLNLACGF